MKFPNFKMNKWFTARAFVLLAGLFLMALTVPAQKTEANPSADLDQCRNGDGTVPCTGSAWVNGNAGFQNSSYAEDQYLPYRMRFTNLTVGTNYTVVIGYDNTHSGAHAIDYLGSYNTLTISNRVTNTATVRAGVDPCSGVAGCVLGSPTSSAPITLDNVAVTNQTNPFTNGPIYQPSNQQMTIWGGSGLTFAYESIDGNVAVDAQVERRIRVTFTATVSNPVLAWSGHVAYGGDWGAGESAGGISGSPYHMRLIGLCVTTTPPAGVGGCTDGGNQDRSLSADAVIISGIVNIVKVVNTIDGSGLAITAFGFTANPSSLFGVSTFSLIDDNAGPGIDTQQSQAITSFGAANAITVSEDNINGWTLLDVSCVNNVASSSSTNLGSRSATITTNAGGVTTCTFTNSQLQVTAAPASVSGRVTTAFGTGISGVRVSIVDFSTGETRTTLSNSFGYYSFSGLDTGDFYQLSVSAKKYSFQQSVKSFSLTADLADVNFVAN